jgi:hypothetical protein
MNLGRVKTGGLFLFSLAVILTGCSVPAPNEWMITVDNRSNAAIDISVTYGVKTANSQSQGNANVSNVAPGKSVPLTVGQQTTVIKTVKVTSGGVAQELTPEVEIVAGKKYVILVGADGKAGGTLSNR